MNELVIISKNRLTSERAFIARMKSGSMELFLAQVEKKAFRMAEIAVQNHSDALDIVQDAMIKLVEKYAEHPRAEWKPLFYRILQNRIMDHFRRKKMMNALFFWKKDYQDDESKEINDIETPDERTPERTIQGERNLEKVTAALKSLPLRQQQCFLLRSWEGLSVKETAEIMGCTEGSVKTHYSRARETLGKTIQEDIF